MDLIGLYDTDPDGYPQGRTADMALASARKLAAEKYRQGKCCFCQGPALRCARRHAHGKSCA